MTDLEKYGQHRRECRLIVGCHHGEDCSQCSHPCTCGLAGAIERERALVSSVFARHPRDGIPLRQALDEWAQTFALKVTEAERERDEARVQLARAREALEGAIYDVKRAVREAVAGSGLEALAANAAESAIRAALESFHPPSTVEAPEKLPGNSAPPLSPEREARGRRLMAATVDAGPDVGEDPDHLSGHEWHQDAEGNPYCASVDCDQTCAALEGRKP